MQANGNKGLLKTPKSRSKIKIARNCKSFRINTLENARNAPLKGDRKLRVLPRAFLPFPFLLGLFRRAVSIWSLMVVYNLADNGCANRNCHLVVHWQTDKRHIVRGTAIYW